MKILITGGAGYIGSLLTTKLLERQYEVTIIDNLMYGGNALLHVINNPNLKFINGDIRDEKLMKQEVVKCDIFIHLAAIVGYPGCEKDVKLAYDINQHSVEKISKYLTKDQLVLFASTGSNYGAVKDGLCTEETPLNPLTTYGISKTQAEKTFLNENNTIAYRFATAFGMSYRPRLDLLINDFVYQAMKMKYIVVYESHFMRTFIHVKDIVNSFLFAIDNREKMMNQVFNVGSDSLNYSKKEVCELINKKIKYYLHLADVGKDMDQRDYIVSYEKITSLGYSTRFSIEDGIDELFNSYQIIDLSSPYTNA